MVYVISYDLGTSSFKATIVDQKLNIIKSAVVEYPSFSSSSTIREQRPLDWIDSLDRATLKLLDGFNNIDDIKAIGISGHSLGIVPVDKNGVLLADRVPIWNDSRAKEEADEFFSKVEYKKWYEITGNGFTRELYSLFKLMWLKKHNLNLYNKTYKFIGTKDFLNNYLCGSISTDHSYASGSGAYNLFKRQYEKQFIDEAGIDIDKLPDIFESSEVIGTIKSSIAYKYGLNMDVKIVAGGVDNACMTLGAGCIKNGDSYVSLGSSSWIATSQDKPIVDFKNKLYTWAHAIKGLYIPSSGIFAAGSAKDYMINYFFTEILNKEKDRYDLFDEYAIKSPIGSNGVIFNPVLAGGSYVDSSPNMKGGLMNFDLSNTKSDIARSVEEGIAFDLRLSFEALNNVCRIDNNIKFVGGGTGSDLWMSIFTDILGKNILKIKSCRNAAAIGAASLALYGIGAIDSFDLLIDESQLIKQYECNDDNHSLYNKYFDIFKKACDFHAEIKEEVDRVEK